jgi:hypothetical protein
VAFQDETNTPLRSLLGDEKYGRYLSGLLGLTIEPELPPAMTELLERLKTAEANTAPSAGERHAFLQSRAPARLGDRSKDQTGWFDLELNIKMAKVHILRGQALVDRQREIVTGKRVPQRLGRRVLRNFQEIQALRQARLDYLLQKRAGLGLHAN